MAGKDSKTPDATAQATKAAPVAANDQGELTVQQLASGIVARTLRPRASDVRRLAEAILAGASAGKKPGKAAKKDRPAKKDGPAEGKKKKDKSPDDKNAGKKKLAKIPGAKTKK